MATAASLEPPSGAVTRGLPRRLWRFVKTGVATVKIDSKTFQLDVGELIYKNHLFEIAQALVMRDWYFVAERRIDDAIVTVAGQTGKPSKAWYLCAFREDPIDNTKFDHYNFDVIAGTTIGDHPHQIVKQFFIAALAHLVWLYPEVIDSRRSDLAAGASAIPPKKFTYEYQLTPLPMTETYPLLRDAQLFFNAPVEIEDYVAQLTFVAESVIGIRMNGEAKQVYAGITRSNNKTRWLGPSLNIDNLLFVLNRPSAEENLAICYVGCMQDNKVYQYQRLEIAERSARPGRLVMVIINMFGPILFPQLFNGPEKKPTFTYAKC